MGALPKIYPTWTPAEYLSFERASPTRHEFINGSILAMAGAKRRHNLVNVNVSSALNQQLRERPCEVYANDMRVGVGKDFVYPDVVVVCGTPAFIDDQVDTLTNPTALIEILSPSTAQYDRVTKRTLYQRIESLGDYLLIDPDAFHVEHYRRQPDGTWIFYETLDPSAVLQIESIGCALTLTAIYEKVALPDEEQRRSEAP